MTELVLPRIRRRRPLSPLGRFALFYVFLLSMTVLVIIWKLPEMVAEAPPLAVLTLIEAPLLFAMARFWWLVFLREWRKA